MPKSPVLPCAATDELDAFMIKKFGCKLGERICSKNLAEDCAGTAPADQFHPCFIKNSVCCNCYRRIRQDRKKIADDERRIVSTIDRDSRLELAEDAAKDAREKSTRWIEKTIADNHGFGIDESEKGVAKMKRILLAHDRNIKQLTSKVTNEYVCFMEVVREYLRRLKVQLRLAKKLARGGAKVKSEMA